VGFLWFDAVYLRFAAVFNVHFTFDAGKILPQCFFIYVHFLFDAGKFLETRLGQFNGTFGIAAMRKPRYIHQLLLTKRLEILVKVLSKLELKVSEVK